MAEKRPACEALAQVHAELTGLWTYKYQYSVDFRVPPLYYFIAVCFNNVGGASPCAFLLFVGIKDSTLSAE